MISVDRLDLSRWVHSRVDASLAWFHLIQVSRRRIELFDLPNVCHAVVCSHFHVSQQSMARVAVNRGLVARGRATHKPSMHISTSIRSTSQRSCGVLRDGDRDSTYENDLISRLEPESDPQHSRSARRTTLQCMCRSASRGQDACSVRWSLGRQTTLEHSSSFWKVWSLDIWLVQQQPCYGALNDTQTYTRGVLDAKSLFLHSRDEWISWTVVVPAPG